MFHICWWITQTGKFETYFFFNSKFSWCIIVRQLKVLWLYQGHSDRLLYQRPPPPPSTKCQGSDSPISNRRAVQLCSKSAVSAHKHTHTQTHSPALKYRATQTHPHRQGLGYAAHTLISSVLSLRERGFQREVCAGHEVARRGTEKTDREIRRRKWLKLPA